MRPVDGALDVAVLYRIVVDVIDVILEVALAANDVIPEAALPDAALATADAAGRHGLVCLGHLP